MKLPQVPRELSTDTSRTLDRPINLLEVHFVCDFKENIRENIGTFD